MGEYKMNLLVMKNYKSIKKIKVENLPNFVVLTGKNGSGKTHLLQAIKDENPKKAYLYTESDKKIKYSKIKMYDIDSFASLNSDEIISEDTIAMHKDNLWNEFSRFRERFLKKEGLLDNNILLVLMRNEFNSVYFSFFEDMRDKFGEQIYNLTREIFMKDYHLPYMTVKEDLFRSKISENFLLYRNMKFRNEFNEFMNNKKHREKREVLNEEEFERKYGDPPWDRINRILADMSLNFFVNKPAEFQIDEKKSFQLKFTQKDSGYEILSSDFSSGEKVILSLVIAIYNLSLKSELPEVILLDEPDARMHPSMCRHMIDVIQNILVNEKNIKVIMTTHSPTTVALVPDESLYLMNKIGEGQRIEKTNKDKALRVLTEGVPSISISYENRKQVFVESDNDILYFEKFYEKLKNRGLNQEISLSFISAGKDKNGGCDQVKKLVEALNENGNNKVFGIIDWDMKNEAVGNIKVLGFEKRYAIENFIFDPIIMSAFLFGERILTRPDLKLKEDENAMAFRNFSKERIQEIADLFFEKIKDSLNIESQEKLKVSYCNGIEIDFPKDFLHFNGHTLEKKIKDIFPGLKKYHNENALKKEILKKTFDDLPEFIPKDIFELFIGIQES